MGQNGRPSDRTMFPLLCGDPVARGRKWRMSVGGALRGAMADTARGGGSCSARADAGEAGRAPEVSLVQEPHR